ncbi:MAG: sodium:solute symporter [Saprospiraceae bacterium]|nr:sodium:solute symporter [Saprospiraceae bacterium]
MTAQSIFITFLTYTIMLFIIGWITSKKANNETFFVGNRVSPWYVVSYGMIGASLSGVTFISVPGDVGSTGFSYMMIVFGYLIGYIVIANVLLPVYYKLNLTSIYTFLEGRFGFWSYKTGAFFFLVSRIIGASFRMFLVVNVLQLFVFDKWGVPFGVTVGIFILLIMVYTFKGGIKTIVWTDTLQTTFMLLAVIISIILIAKSLNVGLFDLAGNVFESEYSKVIFRGDWGVKHHYLKQFLSGIFITIAMTGLDQDMMQKNLTCRNLKDAKKNMYWMSAALVPVNMMFLMLGAILFIYAKQNGITYLETTDDIFPLIALKHLGPTVGVIFIIGLVSAAYSSADSALTALTTSFSVDFLGLNKRTDLSEKRKIRIRYLVHFSVAFVLLLVIVVFREINDQSVIQKLFTVAGYTYGPLLGIFAFGLISKQNVRDKLVPLIAIASPIICYFINENSEEILNGYKIGFELLIINGIITFIGLLLISKKAIKTCL